MTPKIRLFYLIGTPEFVEDGATGLLVEPGDSASLAAAIGRLLAHPDEAKALGHQAWVVLLSRGITRRQGLAVLSDLYQSLATSSAETPGRFLKARMRRAYRLLRLGKERGQWLLSQRPWLRR
jgi:glycosyltransferase involved in cell wall biosynthesis